MLASQFSYTVEGSYVAYLKNKGSSYKHEGFIALLQDPISNLRKKFWQPKKITHNHHDCKERKEEKLYQSTTFG
jgi:hypothetical protein